MVSSKNFEGLPSASSGRQNVGASKRLMRKTLVTELREEIAMDEVFKNSNGFVYAYIYINDRVYEVWKRERVIGSVPGNLHTYIGNFSTIEQARSAVAGLEHN